MELYHNNMSVCAQKVRLVIAEKRLNPVEHAMQLRNGDVHTPEFLSINPKGRVPVLIDHGAIITESSIICEYLDDAYPEPAMSPVHPVLRARMRQWLMLLDTALHEACSIVSVGIAWRHQMLAAGGAQLANRPARASGAGWLASIVQDGTQSPAFLPALHVYDQALEDMARALATGPWLAGPDYSLADAAMLPYVCRIEDLGLSWLWEGDRSAIADWLGRSKRRPNYAAIADYYDESYVALATEKGLEATPVLKDMLGRA